MPHKGIAREAIGCQGVSMCFLRASTKKEAERQRLGLKRRQRRARGEEARELEGVDDQVSLFCVMLSISMFCD